MGDTPSVAGIKAPTVLPVQNLQAPNSTLLNAAQAANKEKASQNASDVSSTLNSATTGGNAYAYSTEKIGWNISPNPAGQEVTLQYYFDNTAPLSIEVFNEAGQLVTNYNLPDNPTGRLNMDG